MKKSTIIFLLGIFTAGIFLFSIVLDNSVSANTIKKIHFTRTLSSSEDPSQGRENHQIAFILSPNSGTLFDGSITFTSSEPVKLAVFHEIDNLDVKGQETWTIDNNTFYALSPLDPEAKSSSVDFTGSALALQSSNSKEFTATVSVDGWIRGQPTEIVTENIKLEKETPLTLFETNVTTKIPMHAGLFDRNTIFYIITDSSKQEFADVITKKQGWKVEFSPLLAKTTNDELQKIFIFRNGVGGEGIHGYQKEIFSSSPSTTGYSSLNSVVEVSWKKGQNASVLESYEDVIGANKAGRVDFKENEVVVNASQVVWSNGQMFVRETNETNDTMMYSEGQITEINNDEMTVTFIAHRGWGPDGQTIYHIITDATPSEPAEIMGVPFSNKSQNFISNSSAVDIYFFKNGIKSSGPLGFQGIISSAIPGDENYSPIWKINLVEWNNPKEAKLLQTISNIDSAKKADLISISLARSMNINHIVNFPFVDPFQ